MTLSELIAAFLADQTRGHSAETLKGHRSKLGQLRRHLGDTLQVAAISRAEIKRWQEDMFDRGLSPWTIKTTYNCVRQFFRWAVDEGHLATDPSATVKPLARPKLRPKALSSDTFKRMLAAARASKTDRRERIRNVAILMMLRHTGGRISELLSIDVADLDFDAGRVLVRGKGDKDRNLYLLDDTIIALREWLEIRPEGDTPALFVGRKGSRLGRDAAYKMIQRLAKAGGVEGIHNPHAFRHAFAVTWLKQGGDISRLQQTLGHSSSKITLDFYALWDDVHLREAHTKFSPHDTNGGKD
jgi:site-specific recombinase XerD